jgi:pilus assembly protein CpaE
VSRKLHNSGFGSLATFTVCADSELSGIAVSAPTFVSGVEFAGDFQDYITANRRPHFPAMIKQADSCVAFIDFDRNPEQAIETADTLRNHPAPHIIPVAVSSRMDADLLLRAMRAGCSEFLEKPLVAARFQETLQQIQGRLLSSLAPPSSRGQVITLMGAKGGVGTTTLAVHLATYLVKKYGKKTLLIDHHHQLGHVCLYLGMKESNYHFDELIKNVERLDSDLLKGFLVKHSSGLEVLASSDTCAAQYKSSREQIEQVLEFLREEYDFILIDSSMSYEDVTESMIHLSDEVTLVATADVAALRDLARHVENQRLSEIAAAKLRIVINRGTSNDAIGPEYIEKAVRFPIHMTIPNNYAELQRAINIGEPIASQRRSDFTAQITKWASRLALVSERPEAAAAPKKAFAFWR